MVYLEVAVLNPLSKKEGEEGEEGEEDEEVEDRDGGMIWREGRRGMK